MTSIQHPTDPSLSIEIAGVTFRIEGPSAVIEPLRLLYARFAIPTGEPSPKWTIRWAPDGCHYDPDSSPLRCTSPALAPSHTSILIGFLLQRSLPGHLFLHGNALMAPDRRALLLLGESGAGKTTLSLLLQDLPGGVYTLAAEDFLVIDPAARLLHPYPRAASIRHAEHGDATADWAGMGDDATFKSLAAPGPCIDSPLSLAHGSVFLLDGSHPSAPAARPANGERCTLWASAASDGLMRALRACGLPFAHCTLARRLPGLVFSRALDAAEVQQAASLLFAHGSLPLGITSDGEEDRAPHSFAIRPDAAPLAGSEAIHRLLADRVRFGRGPEEDAAAAFMRLCSAFQSCRFWQLTPGGTPHETVELLLRLLGGTA